MQPEKTNAIVLRVIDFSETSCVVTLMTRSLGKITALAKGARRPKGPFEAALDVLAICRIVFLHKTNGAMDLLTEAKLERRFKSGSKDLNRLYVGYYVAELLRLLTDDADPHPEAYDLAIKTIESIDNEEPLAQTLLEFELGLLDALGHLPMLTACVSCGREKTTLERVKFGLNDGGVICSRCRPGKNDVVEVSKNAFKVLLAMTGSEFTGETAIGEKEIDREKTEPNTESPVNVEPKSVEVKSVEPKSVKVKSAQPQPVESQAAAITLTKTKPEYTETTKADGFDEVRQLIEKYITHMVGYPPRLHAYLKNL